MGGFPEDFPQKIFTMGFSEEKDIHVPRQFYVRDHPPLDVMPPREPAAP